MAYGNAHGLQANGHGGLWDTSELWAVEPGAVRPQFFALGDTSGSGALDSMGVSGDPRPSSRQLGQTFADIRVRNAVAEIQALIGKAKTEQN